MSRINNRFRFSFYLVMSVLALSVTGAAKAQALPNGGNISGEITVVGEVDQYTFSASAGDTINLRVADTETTEFNNSLFSPNITLIDPNGAVVTNNTGSLVAHLDNVFLVQSGSYTVLVRDDSGGNDDETGSYDIFYARAPGANDDGVLPNGGRLTGNIELGDIDSYTFNADAGETISLRVADTETTEFINSLFSPNIALFGPDGSLITNNTGTLVAHLDNISLSQTGNYTVLIRDESSTDANIGSYDIFYAKASGANDDGVLPNGGLLTGNIDLGDIDSYTFAANAGETVSLRVADTETTEFINSLFSPNVALFGPDGSLITNNTGVLVAHLDNISLSQSGTYSVLVRDESSTDSNAGSYKIFYAKAPGANELGCIGNAQSTSEFIDLGDIDSFSFFANAGIAIQITVSDLDLGTLFPNVTLLSPSGSALISLSNSTTANINATLVESGEYTVFVRDDSSTDSNTGNYMLSIFGVGVSCPQATCNGLPIDVFLSNGDTPSSGDDVILGTPGVDIINAFAGNDTICSLGGNDIINAGSGDDWIDGGSGDDDVKGTSGNDTIFGDIGDDVIRGGSGDDDISGEAGDDSLFGQPGNDAIDGGDGVDDINGGGGNDIIFTGSGATVGSGVFVTGSGGDDTINGGPDADDIKGSTGVDIINGFGGDDEITGGIGRDEIYGGEGNDSILGQESRDTIDGGAGDDVINGGAENDTINGGDGNDEITGGPGNDVLRGDAGSDTVIGGSGDDTLVGGSSVGDFCNGQVGVDTAAASCEVTVGVP